MTLSDSEIIQSLVESISRVLPTAFGEGYELESIPPQRLDRRYSFMFRIWLKQLDGKRIALLVKIPHEAWMETMQQAIESAHIREVITEEYIQLTSIADAIEVSSKAELCAIRPRAILPEWNALLMEEIPIRMLKAFLVRPAVILGTQKAWQVFEAHLQLASEWLRVIHDRFSSGQTATIKSLQVERQVEAELTSLEQFSHRPMRELRSLFAQLCHALSSIEMPLSCLHNDFHLGNIFVTGDGRVGALDPNWVENGPIYADLATVMIDPLTRKSAVFSQGLFMRPSLRMQYEQAVLRGYYGELSNPGPVLDFYCALVVLEKWQAVEELLQSGISFLSKAGSALLQPLVRGYFHRLAQAYLLRGLQTIAPQVQ